MKTLFLLIIIASIVIGTIASIAFFFNPGHQNPCTYCPEQTLSVPIKNNTSLQNISTVTIPNDSFNQDKNLNFEPDHLVVVRGVNSTVRWINEDDVPNFLEADNKDDPLFSNATSASILFPGKSFNFTFTKIGDFGVHGKVHPWLHGWVLVLPQTSENATQTVVLNSSKILGPCEIFRVPCPNNPIFTAQKFGSNIYIEKMTINGVDHYAIIHNANLCTFSTNFGGTCSNPDDLAILRFIGVDILVPRQQANISITGLHLQYMVGEPIDFGIHIQGYGPCDFPSVLVMYGTSLVWKSNSGSVSCPFPMVKLSEIWNLDSIGGPFSLNQTGTYTIHVNYDFNSTEAQINTTSSPFPLHLRVYVAGPVDTNPVGLIKVNQPYQVVAQVTRQENQSTIYYYCIVQVQDEKGIDIADGRSQQIMITNQSSSQCAVRWIPNSPGNYSISAFAWQDLNGTPKAEPAVENVQVLK